MGSLSEVVSVRIKRSVFDKIGKYEGGRQRFFKDAIDEKLDRLEHPEKYELEREAELNEAEKESVLRGAKNISEVMQKAILREAERRQDFLEGMDDSEFAKLVASRLPKETDTTDLQSEVISLTESINSLPSMKDITEELNRVKGELKRALLREETAKKAMSHVMGEIGLKELMESIYVKTIEYVCEMISRKSLVGLESGGGISVKGLEHIRERIELDLKGIHGLRRARPDMGEEQVIL